MVSQYHLLALDLDGTLLNPDRQVSARTQAAVRRVAATGAIVALCSGRATFCTTTVEAQLGLSESLPLLCFNGAIALAPADSAGNRAVLFSRTLTADQVAQVLNVAEALGHAVNFYDIEQECVHIRARSAEQIALMQRYARLSGAPCRDIADYNELKFLPPKLVILCTDVDYVVDYLERNTTGLKIIPEEYFVECLPLDVNKGSGFIKLCNALSVPVDRTVAFGDGWNDIEFIGNAGLGIAMANAKDPVKECSKKVTQFTNKEDGLAIELEQMIEQGLFNALPRHELKNN
ncbi:hypothetical protein HDU83_001178 [Entophlyctis luteolus]|nr:hypothetical protein HDU82_003441 [Entophlyctis luteolus]KAJ3356387.1 hypothetical protein HDU83_001178 [Entophlyctis luteolus]KAJ3394986.1 hypothetical protein HDU84_004444 [Entophlyctis sp. JEL0112]